MVAECELGPALTPMQQQTGPLTASQTSTPETWSKLMMSFILASDSTTSSFTGMLPPTRPVLPPCRVRSSVAGDKARELQAVSLRGERHETHLGDHGYAPLVAVL